MNSNQAVIKKHLEDIHTDITKYLPHIITYQSEVKYADTTYTQEYAQQSKKKSLEKLAAAAQHARDSILQHIESICAAVTELEHQPFVEEIPPPPLSLYPVKRKPTL